jgi:hypothetical protein
MADLDEQKPSRRLWIFAGVCALVLHVGGAALAISHLQTEEADDALGANAIEVGIELASVRHEATDLPAGPDTDASMASPQLAEQKAEVKETDLPKDTPTEAEDPDRVVTPNESKKPKEDDPKVAAVATAASTESVAAEATPSSEAIPKDRGRSRRRWHRQNRAPCSRDGRRSWSPILPTTLSVGTPVEAAEIYRFTLDRLGHVLSTAIEKARAIRR